jgi:hypothetical protein
MSGDRLNAEPDHYRYSAEMNSPPPAIGSDPLVAGLTPTEQLLRILGLAANADDPQDSADSIAGKAERDAQAIETAEAFTTQDQQATSEVNGVAAQSQTAQIAQQIPQMISGIAGALAGALGGALQPLIQAPQQIAQAATQTGMGLYQEPGGSEVQIDDPSATDTPLVEDLSADPGAVGDNGFDGGLTGAGNIGGTSPTGGFAATTATGPLPPIPTAGTTPASAPALPASPANVSTASAAPAAGMAGVPMVPPSAMHGAGEKDTKADTKRVSVPTVRNGSPVQGRISAPPIAPTVIKKVEGKPVATKHILTPTTAEAPDSDYR